MKWNIGWGVVSQCNMHCEFCYSKKKREASRDLVYDDWIRFIDENHEQINSINYGTGENTLSTDWFRLVKYVRDKHPEIRQSLTTNGYLSVAVSNMDCLHSFVEGIDEVDISLDYSSSKKHSEMRGQKDAFKWAIDTLELCNKYKKQPTIVFLGSKVNLYEDNIDGIFSIAQKYCALIRMNLFRPTNGIDNISTKFIINYESIVKILKYINKKYHIISLGDALLSPILTEEKREDPSGINSLRILSNGNVTPSTYLINDSFCIGNIQTPYVLKLLEKEKTISTIIRSEIPVECRLCVYRDSCKGGVYDRRYLWYGTLQKKDPLCPGPFLQPNWEHVSITKMEFQSVHDGYLPTIFFMP